MAAIDDPIDEEDEIALLRRFMQRVTTIQRGTGYYQFYPVIPYTIIPGETVVLSVSAVGFIGWEADPKLGSVNLFDERIDDENAYVSFIMSDERVSIAALYENEVPRVNYENQRAVIKNLMDMHEYGAVPVATSDDVWQPRPAAIVEVPDATVGAVYRNVTIVPPAGVTDGAHLRWEFDFPPEIRYWLEFIHMPDARDGQGNIIGGGVLRPVRDDGVARTPRLNEHGPYYFFLEIFDTITGRPIDIYTFEIFVRRPGSEAEILTPAIPDAMVDTRYHTIIRTANFQHPGGVWELEITGEIPEDFEILFNSFDPSRIVISGDPEVSHLNNSENETSVYTFQMLIKPEAPTPGRLEDDAEFTIQIWDKPTIRPLDVPAPPRLLDGIANINGVEKDYSVTFEASTPDDLDDDPLDEFPHPSWSWSICVNKPPGLDIPRPSTGLTTILSGPPEAPGPYTFTITFTANPRFLIGRVSETYTINILTPPRFDTPPWFDSDVVPNIIQLDDGMADKEPGVTDEPDEPDGLNGRSDWYNQRIRMVGIPSGTRWTWSHVGGTVPNGLKFRPTLPDPIHPATVGQIIEPATGGTTFVHPIDLFGTPAHNIRGDFKFTLEMECIDVRNPNINGAKVTQEFEVRIWPRTYLHITGVSGVPGRVRRDDAKELLTWSTINSWLDVDIIPYEGKRAVMPGTRAVISLETADFIRWDISLPYDETGRPSGVRFNEGSLQFYDNGGIGGPAPANATGLHTGTGYGFYQNEHRYIVIDMPRTSIDGAYDGDVYIRAQRMVGADRPRITGAPGNAYFNLNSQLSRPIVPVGGNFRTDITIRDEIGSGPGGSSVKWEIIDGKLPPGLGIDPFNTGATQFTSGPTVFIDGSPIEEGSFDFTVGITLPGSMILERRFNIVIAAWDGLGDVNDDGVVDLRDLVLLIRFQTNPNLNINLRNARISTNGEPDCECCRGDHEPKAVDIGLLAGYFTHSQGSLRR
jgi:hypothetical protein